MTESQPQHTAQNPQYPGRPRIWTDPETNNIIIGSHDGNVAFSLLPHQADATIDMLSTARTYADSQRSQAKYLHKFRRADAVAEFRRAYLRANAHREIQQSELEDEVQAFSDNYDLEHGFNPDDVNTVDYPRR